MGCLVTNNAASVRVGVGGSGGGASSSTLYQCILIGNSAREGGGISDATLYNCTLVNNSAGYGGGAEFGTLYNSIVYYNYGGDNYVSSAYHSCTTEIQLGEGGNITNDPAVVDYSNGNLRLRSNSPCINSGDNAYVVGSTDLDGNPRIVGGTVDIGAYEYLTPTSIISYAWLQQYGLTTDGSADFIDSDGDGMNNWQEWICGTDPTNPLSVLKMLAPSNSISGITVNWESVNNRTYFLQRSTNLLIRPSFSSIQSNIQGQATTTSFIDTNINGAGAYFYRVGVQQ